MASVSRAPLIKSSTMSATLAQKAVATCLEAIEANYSHKDIAISIRKEFQSSYPTSTWHCFVGRDLGCFVTHTDESYIYLYIGQVGICLFAT